MLEYIFDSDFEKEHSLATHQIHQLLPVLHGKSFGFGLLSKAFKIYFLFCEPDFEYIRVRDAQLIHEPL